jgi:hypothetical protein
MNSQSPFIPGAAANNPVTATKKDEGKPRPSRFIDEKISDESGTETKSDSALAPAGLTNPFWN